jgi:hypothetical protein
MPNPTISYEQLKARAIATRHEARVLPQQGQAPIRSEDETDTDPSPTQVPPSSSNGYDETSQNDADEAATEFDNIAAAYETTPDVINRARTFAQLSPSAQLLHIYFAIEKLQSTIDALVRTESEFTIPPNVQVDYLLFYHTLHSTYVRSQENIKVYAKVLLASPTLKTYEIEVLANNMMVCSCCRGTPTLQIHSPL